MTDINIIEQYYGGKPIKVSTQNDHRGHMVSITVRRDGRETTYQRTNRGAQNIFDPQTGELHDFFQNLEQFEIIAKHKTLLDIGCGGGQWVMDLNRSQVYARGIDLVPPTVPKLSHCFTKGDAFSLQYRDQSFDLVTSFWSVFHYEPLAKLEQLTKEAVRVLRSGGSMFLSPFLDEKRLHHMRLICQKLGLHTYLIKKTGSLQIIRPHPL